VLSCQCNKQGGGTMPLSLRFWNNTDSTAIRTRTITLPANTRAIRFVAFATIPTGKLIKAQYRCDAGDTVNFNGDRTFDWRGIQ
jgi:hypothetical protein